MKNIKVLFVCMGNICRSPTAEGVFTQLVSEAGLSDRFEIDSAGTHSYHIGKKPDKRAQEAALQRGLDLSGLRGREVYKEDFAYFDYILAMDKDNLRDLKLISPKAEFEGKIHLFLDFSEQASESEVPDPYYGGDQGFEHVLDLVQQASVGLLAQIRQQHQL
ncbi:MAG: low molecular weight protein-tyrosine-phosphatase [Gammaproteobacteria bacterium]|nr:low molecular weight protein-tyrosine-phosphatase [Gammaproteobacteria bacterium]